MKIKNILSLVLGVKKIWKIVQIRQIDFCKTKLCECKLTVSQPNFPK